LKTLYVVNWPYHEHREMPKRAMWVKAKVDFQGDDWITLANSRHAAEALATWEVVRGLALLSPLRGLVLMDGHVLHAHSVSTIAAKSHLPVKMLTKGLQVLTETLGWVAWSDDAESPTALSERVYGKAFGVSNSAETPQKHRDARAETPQESPGNSAPTIQDSTVHNINPPTPRKRGKRRQRGAPARSEMDGDWGHDDGTKLLKAMAACLPGDYGAAVLRNKPAFTAFPPAMVYAVLLDVEADDTRTPGVGSAMALAKYRLAELRKGGKMPKRYDKAKEKIGDFHRREGDGG